MNRRQTAPQIVAVHDVVMNQGERMQQLHGERRVESVLDRTADGLT
jgi:hypothetical protein